MAKKKKKGRQSSGSCNNVVKKDIFAKEKKSAPTLSLGNCHFHPPSLANHILGIQSALKTKEPQTPIAPKTPTPETAESTVYTLVIQVKIFLFERKWWRPTNDFRACTISTIRLIDRHNTLLVWKEKKHTAVWEF